MYKSIEIALSKFDEVPLNLQGAQADSIVPKVILDLANLYHHYWMDFYDETPPDPNPTNFEYLKYLMPCEDFRSYGDGIGANTNAKRITSNRLGQAFCRMFLHDFLDIRYFAPISELMKGKSNSKFSNFSVHRVQPGNAPDFICGTDSGEIYLAEAKGRYGKISFESKDFEEWRKQFEKIEVRDINDHPVRVKGFVVATAVATEAAKKMNSCIYAEDPYTRGERILESTEQASISDVVKSFHYGSVAAKLGQKLLSDALQYQFALPEQITIGAANWEVQAGPYKGREFVGGYYDPLNQVQLQISPKNEVILRPLNLLRIDNPNTFFFGVEKKIFEKMVRMARNPQYAQDFRSLHSREFYVSDTSLLNDGSFLAPLEYMRPLGFQYYS